MRIVGHYELRGKSNMDIVENPQEYIFPALVKEVPNSKSCKYVTLVLVAGHGFNDQKIITFSWDYVGL